MKIKTRNLGLFVILAMLFIGIIGIANAQEALPKGGDSFETAVKLETGSYTADREIAQDSYEYFKITLKAGQVIKVKFTTPGEGSPYAGASIYSSEEEQVQEEVIIGDPNKSETLVWAPSKTGIFYITVGNSYNENAKGTKYAISLEDLFDAGSQTDAGSTFDKAMKITKGEYEGYLSGKKGDDTEDLYKIAVKKGTKLTVILTPPEEASPSVKLYDSSRKVIESKYASNPGAIVTVSVSITKSEDVFIELSCDRWQSKDIVSYTLNVETEKGAVVEEEEEEVLLEEEIPIEEVYPKIYPEEVEEAAKAVKRGFRWVLIMGIVGVIVIIIIIVLVVYFLARKKKK